MALTPSSHHSDDERPASDLAGEPEVSADDLRQLVRLLDLVPIPEHLMPKVLAHVRGQRRRMGTFARSGIDISEVIPVLPHRS